MMTDVQYGFMVLPRSLDKTSTCAELGESLGISAADCPTIYQDSYLHQLGLVEQPPVA